MLLSVPPVFFTCDIDNSASNGQDGEVQPRQERLPGHLVGHSPVQQPDSSPIFASQRYLFGAWYRTVMEQLSVTPLVPLSCGCIYAQKRLLTGSKGQWENFMRMRTWSLGPCQSHSQLKERKDDRVGHGIEKNTVQG